MINIEGNIEGSINATCRRRKNLKELISPSLSLQSQLTTKSRFILSKCGKIFDSCDNFLVCRNEFTCKITGKTCKVRGNLSCHGADVVSIISCKWCKDQYIASACKNNFKPRFRVHKSNINTIKGRCGVAKHFLTKCTDIGKLWNIKVHLIKQVEESNYDGKLWCRENY